MKRRLATVGIRGAGVAGLSLARELLALDPNLSISFFDTRPRTPHPQRTFCYFRPCPQERLDLPVHSWHTVIFRGKRFERRIDVSANPYTMLHGDVFFNGTIQALESHKASFRWDSHHVSLETNAMRVDDELIPFDAVIDAAFNPTTESSRLWQSFGGVWVSTKNPTFDPHAATLMDLEESNGINPVAFMYILPISSTNALVEHTTFSQIPSGDDYHVKRCFEWLDRNVSGDYQILDTERGLIPMGLKINKRPAHTVIGSNSGTVRPATGYAFLATQRQARKLARRLLCGEGSIKRNYPLWLEAGDRLFLRALARSPSSGADLLGGLLAGAPAGALINFLAGKASLSEAFSVWMSAPKISMLRAVILGRENRE